MLFLSKRYRRSTGEKGYPQSFALKACRLSSMMKYTFKQPREEDRAVAVVKFF